MEQTIWDSRSSEGGTVELNILWWTIATSDGGTVEDMIIEQWNRDGGTA